MSPEVGGWSKKVEMMSTWLLNDPLPYLKYYFQRHVCLSIRTYVRPYVRTCVRRLAPIPAGESQDVTNTSCSICLRGDKNAPWRSRT